jgi:hypothetical protein
VAQQGAKLRCSHAARNGLVAHAEAPHLVLRQIDAVLQEIHAHILPEVGELQGGAGRVGKLEFLLTHFAASVEHQTAHGIGRVAAVAEHLVHIGVTRDGLILAEGDKQIGERFFGNLASADGLGERDKDWMAGAALVAGVELASPEIE